MECETEIGEQYAVIRVKGRVDAAVAPDLERVVNDQIGSGKRHILLDFRGVPYISSGGMRVLLATAKKLRGEGDKFALSGLTPEVQKILNLAGFTTILKVYPDEATALLQW
ncbi:MAG: STAS domain-containing protein [Methanomicrobiales archaeon]|jgi:anti-anti-sigma factor|nr:STAS domain-containing protein [Methanomicrobiales archaeon]